MKKVIYTLLLLATVTFVILASCEWEEEPETELAATIALNPTSAATGKAPGASATPNRTASPRPNQTVTRAPGLTATSVLVTSSANLSRFRVGYSTAYSLSVNPNLWEAAGIATPTGLAYSLTYKKLPGCQLLDEAGRDAPAGWSHVNSSRSLGGRTYTQENWVDPASGNTALIIYALDPRIRIELHTPAGSSECIQAAEIVIAASTPALLGP